MSVRKTLKRLIRPIYNHKLLRHIIDYFICLVWNAKPIRKYLTRGFSTGYLAVGEQNKYCISPEWVTLDMAGADFNYDFRKLDPMPFGEASTKLIYSSHMIEHLPEKACQHFFSEAYRILQPGGMLRVEAPDVEKLISEYRNNNRDFFISMLNEEEKRQLGKELDVHDVFVGLIACYINNDKHVAVKVSKEEVDHQVHSLSFKEFSDWCISLLSPEQIQSGGHITPIYFDKINAMLAHAGFKQIHKASVGTSKHQLMNKKLSGIERAHRANYSLYVEAVK